MDKRKVVPGQVGKRLLEEVAEEDLTKFLSSLRSSGLSIPSENPYYPSFNIPSFDKLLLPLFYNHCRKYPYTHQKQQLFPEHNASPAFQLPFIELTSTSPCAGKTHLLYLICTVSVLPQSHLILSSPTSTPVTLHLNGKNGTIVVLDSDNRFSVPRLSMIMRNYIYSHLSENESPSLPISCIENLIHNSLKHIHIFRFINSTQQLISTLASLPKGFLSALTQSEPDRHLTGIIIDSVSTFYWEDRAGDSIPTAGILDEELSQQIQIPDPYVNPMITLADIYQPLVAQLHALQELFGCFVVATRRMHVVKARDGQMIPQDPLPNPWTMAVTLRILVDREQQCQEGEALYRESAGQSWFRGRVEMVGGMWGGREGLEILKHERNGMGHIGIKFSIGRCGIDVIDTEV